MIAMAVALAAPPSLAVLKLEAKSGVQPEVAELLLGNLAVRLRNDGCFDKIVTSKDIETLLGFEQQKQMLSCDDSSCIAEIASAMGVDYVASGTLGKLGALWLINVSIVDARTARPAASVSMQITGADEGALVQGMEKVVANLLAEFRKSGRCGAAATPTTAITPPSTTAATPAATPSTESAPASDEGFSPRTLLLRVGAIGVFSVALVGVLLGVGAALVGGGLLASMFNADTNPAYGKGTGMQMFAVIAASTGFSALMVPLVILLGIGAVALLGISVVAG